MAAYPRTWSRRATPLLALAALSVTAYAQPATPVTPLLPATDPMVDAWAASVDDEAAYQLPSSSRTIVDPAVRLAEAPSLPAHDPLGIGAQQSAESILPPGTRQGVFQKANFQAAYLPRFEDDSIGVSALTVNSVFGVPFPRRETPLLFTPQYRAIFLNGPDFTDVPSRVHEAELGISHFRKLTDRWLFNGAVTIGAYADDHSFGDGDAIRVTGRALGVYELNNRWKGVLGVVYLNRAGLSVVPAAGLMYDDGAMKVDLLFPRPRVAWLLPGSTPVAGDQRWLFVMGELGGNIWAVRRAGGTPDTLSYSDLRLVLGYERNVIGGVSQTWELGYVFNRELEFDGDGFDSGLDDTLMTRVGFTY